MQTKNKFIFNRLAFEPGLTACFNGRPALNSQQGGA
jgi:hypothetical protein